METRQLLWVILQSVCISDCVCLLNLRSPGKWLSAGSCCRACTAERNYLQHLAGAGNLQVVTALWNLSAGRSQIRKLVILFLIRLHLTAFNSTHLSRSVRTHEGQEGRQVGELEPHKRALDETVEADIVVVAIATEGWWACQQHGIPSKNLVTSNTFFY